MRSWPTAASMAVAQGWLTPVTAPRTIATLELVQDVAHRWDVSWTVAGELVTSAWRRTWPGWIPERMTAEQADEVWEEIRAVVPDAAR